MKKILTTLFLSVLFLTLPTEIKAEETSLALTPPVVEVLISPNKKVIQAFTIKNKGSSGQFVINIHAVKPLDDQGHVELDPNPLDFSSIPLLVTLQNSNLEFNQPFTIPASASEQIVLGIEGVTTDINQDAYFALVVSSYTNSDLAITSRAGISSLVLATLSPSGTLPVDLELQEFDPPLIHDSSTPLSFSPLVFNKTPTMMRVQGTLILDSGTGNNIEQLSLYPTLILANSSRTLKASSGEPPISTPLEFQPHPLTFGPQKLRLTITTVGNTKIQEIERVVWYIPLKLTLTIIIVIFTISSIYAWRSKKTSIDSSSQNI